MSELYRIAAHAASGTDAACASPSDCGRGASSSGRLGLCAVVAKRRQAKDRVAKGELRRPHAKLRDNAGQVVPQDRRGARRSGPSLIGQIPGELRGDDCGGRDAHQ